MSARSAIRAAVAGAVGLAVAPGSAGAHSLVRPSASLVSYISADATSLNTLTVRANGSRIEFHDPSVDGGMDPGSCTPGALTDDANSWIIQTFCPTAGVTTVRLDLGEREDSATVSLNIPATILGGPGADRLQGGPAPDQLSGDDGDDTLAGGDGGDVILGGFGVDDVSGETGDDDIRVRDGIQDRVRCGDGNDKVDADTLDELAADCETVLRTPTAPPPGDSAGGDRVAPRVEVGAPSRRRIGSTRKVQLFATSTERGHVAASGALRIGDLALPINVPRRRIAVGGGGSALVVTLSRSHHRQALRALRRGRRVSLRLTVVATDAAGNSRPSKPFTIRLVR